MVDTFFIMDLCFNFIRPTDTGNRARKLDRIRQNYVAFWFWVDTISSIPYVGCRQPSPSLTSSPTTGQPLIAAHYARAITYPHHHPHHPHHPHHHPHHATFISTSRYDMIGNSKMKSFRLIRLMRLAKLGQ